MNKKIRESHLIRRDYRIKYFIGVLMCLVSVIIWGSMFPIMENVLKIMDPFNFTLIRYSLASIIFIVLLVISEGVGSLKLEGKLFFIWLYGSIGFAGFGFLVFFGQKIIGGYIGAINASTIESTMPIIGVIIVWFTHKTKPNLVSFFLILLSFIGIIIITGINSLSSLNKNIMGDICLLLGTFSWAFYTVGINKFPSWSPIRYTALTCIFGVFTMMIIVSIFDITKLTNLPTINNIFSIWWELLFMSLVAGVIAVFTWNIGNKIIGPINGVFFINLIPITTLIITILNGERVQFNDYIGIFIIMLAITGNNFYNIYKTNFTLTRY